jgi:DNA-binding transcriptional ArsR family regulator
MSKIEDFGSNSGKFSYDGLDRVIHEKARLGILTSLVANPGGLSFADLKLLCGLTDGNLSRHLQVLQEDDIIEITKRFEKQRPLTSCKITATGRKRYLGYLTELEKVVKDAAAAIAPTTAVKLRGRLSPT